MLNVDLSNIVRRSSLAPLSAFIPGLFFEISILLGNPQLITSRTAPAEKLVPLSPYLQLAIALFLAFIIGRASMLLVHFIQHVLTYVHLARLALSAKLRTPVLIPMLNQLANMRLFASRPTFQNLRARVSQHAADAQKEARPASTALHKLASKLFLERYGVNLGTAGEELEPLLWAVGTLTELEWRGPLLIIASEATGWCGLVATTLAPTLRNSYYIALSLIFLLTGLHNDYRVAGRRTDPEATAAWKTRAILREYENGGRTTPHSQEKTEPPQEPEGPDHA